MKTSIICAALVAALSSSADVVRTDMPPSIDGRLDDACWAAAEWNGPFVRLANSVKDRTVRAQTRFAMLADAKTLYVAVKCDEPDMAALKARNPSALYTCERMTETHLRKHSLSASSFGRYFSKPLK